MKSNKIKLFIVAIIITLSSVSVYGNNKTQYKNSNTSSDEVVSPSVFFRTDFTETGGAIPSPLVFNNDTPHLFNVYRSPSYMTNDPSDVNYYYDYNQPSNFAKKYITSVKDQRAPTFNQEETNNCWIFSTIAAMESAAIRRLYFVNNSVNFSEEHVRQKLITEYLNTPDDYRYCVLRDVAGGGWVPYNVKGNNDWTLSYLTRFTNRGAAFENKNLPFYSSLMGQVDNVTMNLFGYIPTGINAIANIDNNTTNYSEIRDRVYQIKDLINSNKNATVSLETRNSFYYFGTNYKSNSSSYIVTRYYYNNGNYTGLPLHAVELVGWDDSVSVVGAAHKGAFVAKNSYGHNNSNADGFLYISYDNAARLKDIRSISTMLSVDEINNAHEIDTLGFNGSNDSNQFFYTDTQINNPNINTNVNNFVTVQKFTDGTSGERIKRVFLPIDGTNTGFKVYISPTGNFSDFQLVSLSQSSSINPNIRDLDSDGYNYVYYGGLYNFALSNPTQLSNSNFLVAVEYKRANSNENIKITTENKDPSLSEYSTAYAVPQKISGQSYVQNLVGKTNILNAIKTQSNYSDIYNGTSLGRTYTNFNIRAYS